MVDGGIRDKVKRSEIRTDYGLQENRKIESGEMETFANMFESEDLDMNSLNSNLAELLKTNQTELPRKLKEVGQELAFCFAVNGELYEKFAASLTRNQDNNNQNQPQTRQFQTLTTQSVDSKSEMRDMLLKFGVSETLNKRLGN